MAGRIDDDHLVVDGQLRGEATPRPSGLREAVDEHQPGRARADGLACGCAHAFPAAAPCRPGYWSCLITTAATFCATLVDEWVRAGVTDAVVAPGSRSTPLALALAADPAIRIHVHHDERSASFLALGLGLATAGRRCCCAPAARPAAELHPAVVEAHQAEVPLIVCTADRPPELRDVGAPQTIDQPHLFGSAVRWFGDPGVPDDAMGATVALAGGAGRRRRHGRPPGPVHLNLPFRDPLVGEPGPLPPGAAPAAGLARHRGGCEPARQRRPRRARGGSSRPAGRDRGRRRRW